MSEIKILVVEDDRDIAELIQYNLLREGYGVSVAEDGESALAQAVKLRPALVVLDLMLPKIDGLEVCRRLRQSPATQQVPVIMVTAKGEESDVVLGLGIGADDYLVKPFSPKELVARVQAALRRARCGTEASQDCLTAGAITMNVARHEVFVDGQQLQLTLAEFRLLQSLIANRGRVLTREQILNKITDGETYIIDRNVDVHVRSIRKKLGALGDQIVTVRGVGYKCAD